MANLLYSNEDDACNEESTVTHTTSVNSFKESTLSINPAHTSQNKPYLFDYSDNTPSLNGESIFTLSG